MSTQMHNLEASKTSLINSMSALAMRGLKTQEEKESYKRSEQELSLLEERIVSLKMIESKLDKSESRNTRETLSTISETVTKIAAPAIHTEDKATAMRAKVISSMRKYLSGKSDAETRDLNTTTAEATIAQTFESAINEAQKFFGETALLVKQSHGVSRKIVNTDSTNINLILKGEGATIAATNLTGDNYVQQPVSIFSTIENVDSIAATIQYSLQELADADDLTGWLRDTFGEATSRAIELALTTGSDFAGTALPNSPTGGMVATAVAGSVTSALADGVGISDFVNLFTSFSTAGQYAYINPKVNSVAVVMNPANKLYLQGLKNGFGESFFSLDSQGDLTSILGVRIVLNNAMPVYNPTTPLASQVFAIAGDLNKGYHYLNGGSNLVYLRERFIADTNIGASVVYHRMASSAGISGALRTLKLAAS